MTEIALRRLALASYAAQVVLICWSLFLAQALTPDLPLLDGEGHERDTAYWVMMLAVASAALFLIWARPRNNVGWVLSLTGVLGIVCNWGQLYGSHALAVPGSPLPFGSLVLAWSAPLWIPALLTPATLLLARYPTGSLQPGRALLVDRATRVAMVSLWIGYASMDAATTDEVRGSRPPVQLPDVVGGLFLAAGGIGLLLCAALVVGMTLRRMLRAEWPERPQIAWLLTASAGSVVLVLLAPFEWMGSVAFSLLPLGIALGVLRYRLLGIEVVVRRALLYGGLTGLVLLTFVAVTSGLSSFVGEGLGPTVIGAIVVAVVLAPARDRLQRVVDRLVYGDRSDPWRAFDRLGREAASSDALTDVVAAVAESLRLPGVELRSLRGTVVSWGDLSSPTSVPLVVAGDAVGQLSVSPRRGESSLHATDERLLTALGPMLGLLVRSTEMAAELQVQQERVVQATESERARLRRELHDGLGPSLTGVGLGLEAVDSDVVPERQRVVVRRLRAEVSASLEEVRRIIDDLRPGALETSDLLTLVRARAEHLTATTPLRVTVQAPVTLHLDPEVEAAALRIVEEALTNVVRHAGATSCTVRIDDTAGLTIEVTDDGIGFVGPRDGGVGLSSMRSRAASLGGSLELAAAERGTVLVARLPS